MQSEDPDLHPIYQRLLQGQSRPTEQEVARTSWETRRLLALCPKLVKQENVLFSKMVWPISDELWYSYPRSRPSCVGCMKRRLHGAQYQLEDEVWQYDAVPPLGIPSKLHKQWKGPYTIDEALTDAT
ncbi:hypothetical protein EG68_04045 [Paragonimus skrjabini miyazakii]|uniref:Uncharacterized protein n=1 Tax=Paragonimus skrjabini miyazakii TaxID=59628 RepID=A0A8S9YVW5_9TREM|nr:hypothetical protein EG68_04045 [Paragonimus skrjabini miyazakii]